MEKRIPYMHYQQVKSVAKTIDPLLRQKSKIQAQIDGLDEEFIKKGEEALSKLKIKLKEDKKKALETLNAALKAKEDDITLFEAGIFNNIGLHVTDLVRKVIEPTGKTDAEGKPIKVTKYIPTDIVTYDEKTKEYVITIPDDAPESNEETGTEEQEDDTTVVSDATETTETPVEDEAPEAPAETSVPWE